MLIDTHLHLVDRDRLSYPWLSGVPALNRDWTFASYTKSAKDLGISGALHMEVDVAEQDIHRETDMVAQLMASVDSLLLGAISAARPEASDFESCLDGINTAVIKGLRRVLHVVPDEISLSTSFRDNIKRLGPKGLPFDICVSARQLPIAAALVDAAPNTSFVLDHCGVPDIAAGDYTGWAAAIREIAKRSNLNAKISGITAYTGDGWTVDTLRPYVEHIIDSFGWDRVVWGSDSPVCTLQSSLEQWVEITHQLTQGAAADDLAKLHHVNATRIWGL